MRLDGTPKRVKEACSLVRAQEIHQLATTEQHSACRLSSSTLKSKEYFVAFLLPYHAANIRYVAK